MNTSPFSPISPGAVSVRAAVEPVYGPLVSLAALNAPREGADAWVLETAGRLTPQQRRDNRIVFEGLWEVLLPGRGARDLPAFLDALSAEPPAALRDQVTAKRIDQLTDEALRAEVRQLLANPATLRSRVVQHVRALWDQHLAAEWRRHQPELTAMTNHLNRSVLSQPAWSARTAAEAIRGLARRPVPDAVLAQLDGIREVTFVLSPHVQLHAARLGGAEALWVFIKPEAQIMRQAPVKRSEVLGPLGALADDTRLRILEMLAEGEGEEARAQDLIARLGVSQPNVSRHLKQLVGAGFVAERRAGDANKLYRLNDGSVEQVFFNLSQVLTPGNARAVASAEVAAARLAQAKAGQPQELQPYLDVEGRVARWPTKVKVQDGVIRYLADKLVPGREYTEKELGAVLREWFLDGDVATVRRAMFEMGLLNRTPNGSKYWRSDR